MMRHIRIKRIKIVLLVLIVVMMVLPVGVFILKNSPKKLDPINEIVPSAAEFSMKKVRYTHMTEEKKAWELEADSAQYHKEEDRTILKKVKALFYGKEGEVITMTGDRGKVTGKNKDIEIVGNVTVRSTRGYFLRTGLLNYNADQKRIFTPDHVKITGDGMKIEGDGMTMDLEGKNLSILKNVQSSFQDMKFF